MKLIRKILEQFRGNIIIYGKPMIGHSFSSCEKYLEYKKQQQSSNFEYIKEIIKL